ncbi:MAG: putative toxin-antitoxin system toxin component, PIN family [Thermomicrobiales bacterium]
MACSARYQYLDFSVYQPDWPTGSLARSIHRGRYQLIASQPLLDEISAVLLRPRVRRAVRVSDERIALWFRRLQGEAILTAPEGNLRLCRDPKDNIVLETAILGEAHYLVSRDADIARDLDLIARLHEHNIEVVTVAQFLALLGEG